MKVYCSYSLKFLVVDLLNHIQHALLKGQSTQRVWHEMNVIQRLSQKCVQKKYALPCQTKATYLLLSLLPYFIKSLRPTFTDALTLIHPPADGTSTISVFEVMKVAQLGSLALSRNLSMNLPPDYTPLTLAEVFYMATMGGAQGINLSYYKWSPLYSLWCQFVAIANHNVHFKVNYDHRNVSIYAATGLGDTVGNFEVRMHH